MTSIDLVSSADHGPIRVLTLARAPVNALDPALCRALRAALGNAIDDGVQGIVLAGGQNVFSAGLDVPYLLGLERDALADAWSDFFAVARALAACHVPVVAAIAGHAPAGGCVLALCCDYRIMVAGPFRIGLNETQVGLAVPHGIMRLLQRVVGHYRAERLLLNGELVDAARALEIGLVDELVDGGDLDGRARAWLAALLALPRAPMLTTRARLRADLVDALQPANLSLESAVDAWYEPDTQQALQAMVARLRK